MRISDWSSDVCYSDLRRARYRLCGGGGTRHLQQRGRRRGLAHDGQGSRSRDPADYPLQPGRQHSELLAVRRHGRGRLRVDGRTLRFERKSVVYGKSGADVKRSRVAVEIIKQRTDDIVNMKNKQ